MRKTIFAFLSAASLMMATWSNQSYARQTNPGDGTVLPEIVVSCEYKGSHTFQINFDNMSYSVCFQLWKCSYGWDFNFC